MTCASLARPIYSRSARQEVLYTKEVYLAAKSRMYENTANRNSIQTSNGKSKPRRASAYAMHIHEPVRNGVLYLS